MKREMHVSISSLSAAQSAALRSDANIRVLKEIQDVSKQQGAAAVQLLRDAAELAKSAAPNPLPGGSIDLRA